MSSTTETARFDEPDRWPQSQTAEEVSDEISDLNRLQRKLERARARYERAIAALDKSSDELERRALSRAIESLAMNAADQEYGQGEKR